MMPNNFATYRGSTSNQSLKADLEGKSLFFLSQKNCFRIMVARVVKQQWFDSFILILILFASILLTLENPLDNPDGMKITVIKYLDIVATSFFVLEMVLKVITFGFIFNGKESYLRSLWNILDLVTVLFSLLSIILTNSSLKVLKVFRMVRVLRPLRVISRNEGLRVAVLSLLNSVTGILNIFVISMLFFLLFGILGINYFKGAFFYCQ